MLVNFHEIIHTYSETPEATKFWVGKYNHFFGFLNGVSSIATGQLAKNEIHIY